MTNPAINNINTHSFTASLSPESPEPNLTVPFFNMSGGESVYTPPVFNPTVSNAVNQPLSRWQRTVSIFWSSYETTGKYSGGVQGAMALFKEEVHEAVKDQPPVWQAVHGGLTSLTGFVASVPAGIVDLIVQAYQETPIAPDLLWPLTAGGLIVDGTVNSAHHLINDVGDLLTNGFSPNEKDVFTQTTRISGDALIAGTLAYSAWSLTKPINLSSLPSDLELPFPITPSAVAIPIPAVSYGICISGSAALQSTVLLLMSTTGGDGLSEYKPLTMSEEYLGEEEGKSEIYPGQKIKYCSPEEAEIYRVNFDRDRTGKIILKDESGNRLNLTKNAENKSINLGREGNSNPIFVMDLEGNIYIREGTKDFYHSSFLKGKDVAAAGEIKIKNGKIVAINNRSGHYWAGNVRYSDSLSTVQFLNRLKQLGIDISQIDVVDTLTGKSITGRIFLTKHKV